MPKVQNTGRLLLLASSLNVYPEEEDQAANFVSLQAIEQ